MNQGAFLTHPNTHTHICRVFQKGLYKILGGIGHIKRIQNYAGTYVLKRHLNTLQTICFRLFLRDVGASFKC